MKLKRIQSFSGALMLGFFAAVSFVFLNGQFIFQPYFAEDYHWLLHLRRSTFYSSIIPYEGSYYRPLSVNLPYWIFSSISHGEVYWGILALALLLVGYFFLWLWLNRLSGDSFLAIFLASLWLFHPALPFSLFYRNAFDYCVFPVLMILYLWALDSAKWKTAHLFHLLACFSKELALGFPVFLALKCWKNKRIEKMLLVSIGISSLNLILHRGVSLNSAGGYPFVGEVSEIGANFLSIFSRVFLGYGFSLGKIWIGTAWAALVFLLSRMVLQKKSRFDSESFHYLIACAALLFPLIFLHELPSDYLGPTFWILILAALAKAHRCFRNSENSQTLFGVATGFLVLVAIPSTETKDFFLKLGKKYSMVLEKSAPLLAACGPLDQVLVGGLENVFPSDLYAELAIPGLKLKFPHVKFYLEDTGAQMKRGARKSPWMWTSYHPKTPRIYFSKYPGKDQWKVEGFEMSLCTGNAHRIQAITPPI